VGEYEFVLRLLAEDMKGFGMLMIVLVGRLALFHLEEAEFSVQVSLSSPIIIIHIHLNNCRQKFSSKQCDFLFKCFDKTLVIVTNRFIILAFVNTSYHIMTICDSFLL
jgi:hypothetical protein